MNCFYDCGYILKPEYEEYHDIYDIYLRIKYINSNYRLLYNRNKKQCEIHNIAQPFSTLIVVWNESIDMRIIEYLFNTKVENSKNIFEMVETQNTQIELENNKKICEKTTFFVNEALNLAEQKSGTLTKKDLLDIKKYMKE